MATAIFEWFEIIFLKNIRGKIETIKISINSIITSALKVLILQTLLQTLSIFSSFAKITVKQTISAPNTD